MKREEIMSVLSYEPQSGVFTWIAPVRGVKKGSIAGSNQSGGYVQITIAGKRYYAHRLAWAIVHGEIDRSVEIDHVDGNRSNNAISNLRIANRSENCFNTRRRINNKSGVKGVYWSESHGKWKAELNVNGSRVFSGYFTSLSEAGSALREQRLIHHGEFANHGDRA